MIRSIEVQGFRSLRSTRIELRPLNVLIGPNQSGKTNVIDALAFLAAAMQGQLASSINQLRGGMSNLLWAGSGPRSLRFRVELAPRADRADQKPITYGFSIEEQSAGHVVAEEALETDRPIFQRNREKFWFYRSDGTTSDPSPSHWTELILGTRRLVDPEFDSLTADRVQEDLASLAVYPGFDIRTRWSSGGPRETAQMRQPQYVEHAERLSVLGDNLVNVLYTMSQDRDLWQDFKDAVRVGFRDLEDIVFPADAGQGRITLAWIDRRFPRQKFPAEVLSAGTLCFLATAAAVMSPGVPALTAIDEPEMHMHPELLYRLVGLLEKASHDRQILITTHSDALLSYLSDPSSIVLVDNGPDGTTLTRPDEADLAEWLKTYSLGQLREAGHLAAFAQSKG